MPDPTDYILSKWEPHNATSLKNVAFDGLNSVVKNIHIIR